jgi:hypothetical protein
MAKVAETFASDAHLLLLFDLRGIELHVDARRVRNLQQALHRLQRILQEVLIHVVPLCQIFLIGRMDRRLRCREVDIERRRMAVRE